LGNAASGITDELQEAQSNSQRLSINTTTVEVRTPDDLDGAFQSFAGGHVQAAMVLVDAMLFNERKRIAALAAEARLPDIYGVRDHVEAGGLISYGVDTPECFRRSAAYVHKILQGARPADLPVEFPTRLELVINLKTAKALGLIVPPTLLATADEVIE
jgi:putative ABC transport system substrate-binding protein